MALFALGLAMPAAAFNLTNGALSLDIRPDNGAISAITFGGSNFFDPGTPVANFGFQLGADTTTFLTNDASGGTQQPVTVTTAPGSVSATGTYTAGGANVAFVRTYSLVPGQNVIRVNTQLTNNGASSVTLRYFDTFDPDQGFSLGLGYSTYMDVFALTTNVGAISVGQAAASNDLTFLLGPTTPGAAVVSSGTYFSIPDGTTLNTVFSAPADADGNFEDTGLHIIYERAIDPGQTVTVEDFMSFGTTEAAAQTAFAASFVPSVTTQPASTVTYSTANLPGSVNPNGSMTTAHFRYGTDPTLAAGSDTTGQFLGNGTNDASITAAVFGLFPQTTYYFQVIATNSLGTNSGAILNFTTPAQPPTVTTLPATAIVPTGAFLNGSVNPNSTSTDIHFEYSTDPGLAAPTSTTTVNIGDGSAAVTINAAVTGLLPRTTYYFRAVAANPGGTVSGTILSFYTGVVNWGGTGTSASNGTLDASLISTNGTQTFTDVNGQGYYVVVTTSGLNSDGVANYFGEPDLWFEGGGPSNGYGTVTFRFYNSLTNQPYAVSDVDFRLLDAEVNERFRSFGYWDANNNFVSIAYGSSLLAFSNTPVYHATDGSIENNAAAEGGDQLGKWIEVNLSTVPITGFTLQAHRQTSGAGSVIMSDLISPWAAWRTTYFGPPPYPANADDYADPDGDGNANLLEYFFGTDPMVADAPNPMQMSIVSNRLTLSFPRSNSATDATATVQGADTPTGPWTDLARSINGGPFAPVFAGVPVSEIGSGAIVAVQAGDQYFANDPLHPTRFLRLLVVH